jgi:nitrogen fixation protein NifU and related proteins
VSTRLKEKAKDHCAHRYQAAARGNRTYNEPVYTDVVLSHFRDPHNAGDIFDADGIAVVTNPVCGDVLRLAVRVSDGRITEARFKAQGCVAAIASGSVLTDMLIGKTTQEAARVKPQEISDALGGLPPATFHAAQLCCDAVTAAMRNIG